MKRLALKSSRILLAAIGSAVIALWIRKIGMQSIVIYLKQLNWRFCFILINAFVWYILYTLAWEKYFSAEELKSNIFSRLLRIKIVGEAINLITPLGFVAGDSVRLSYTRKFVPGTSGCGSIIVDRTIHLLATMLVVCFGMMVLFIKLPDIPVSLRIASGVILATGLIGVFFLIWSQRKGHLAQRLAFLNRVKWIDRRFPHLHLQLEKVDASTNAFFSDRPNAFWQALAYHLGGRILGITEIGLILYFLSGKLEFSLAIILAVLTASANFIFSFVPGGLGVLESMYGLVFVFFHADPSLGLSVQIVRRMRALFWITIGVSIMGHVHRPVQICEEEA